MLTEICNYLKNWFSDEKYIGYIRISDGYFYCNDNQISIVNNRYIRIIGSVVSDGVYKYGTDTFVDEGFNGAVWLMRVPSDVIALAGEIAEWMAKYGNIDSVAMSPYQSESFGGYSYSKAGTGSNGETASVPAWALVYGGRLARYRKL